jgi:hypothetical protein
MPITRIDGSGIDGNTTPIGGLTINNDIILNRTGFNNSIVLGAAANSENRNVVFQLLGGGAINGAWQFRGRVSTPDQPHIFCKTLSNGTAPNTFFRLLAKRTTQGGMSVGTAGGQSAIYAPVSGVYAVTYNGIASSDTGRRDMNIFLNGGTFLSSLNEENGSGFHYRTISVTVYLAAGDYLQIRQTAGTFYYTDTSTGDDAEWGNFSVTLLG